ncbi:deca-heme c-type cytochrome [Photobacterium profundum]|uniref:multiheme c-type cytochrome n=1 Tax=Photobacterium profundum TaxID=74109 RepID=UPI003D12E56D
MMSAINRIYSLQQSKHSWAVLLRLNQSKSQSSTRQTLSPLFLGLVILFSTFTIHAEDQPQSQPTVNTQASSSLTYVGTDVCIDCHENEYKEWQGSDHDMAMRHADTESVLGNFNNAELVSNGKTNRFFKKGTDYWANIADAEGKFNDYKISYTFGFKPLQQYMVEFEDGRIQLIPFAWDSRPKADGGQRWFNLYPDMKKTDEFFWTNTGQNWNFMCADCHSTNLKKNYDKATDTYNTSWFEINVGCEACHGAASEHMAWTEKQNTTTLHTGFDRDLGLAVKEWVYQEGKTTLQPKSITPTDQIKVCAQCHSRRMQLNEDANHVKDKFLDRYMLSMITPELYEDNGQIFDEDYVLGSFLQSKMHDKGVVCSNCHNPHTTELKIPKEAVCNQCHIASEYTAEKHTFHEAGTDGAQCTSCHMPQTTYMQVDPRRDHSWQVPRPDLSKNIGTPNVCTSCHEDKDTGWADKQVGKWFPNSPYRNKAHFANAFYAADLGYQNAGDSLSYIAQDIKQSDIIRASALQRLERYPSRNSVVALARAVKNDNEMIRLGAVQGSAPYPFSQRWQIIEKLLTDSVLAVRAEAAGALASSWQEMTPVQREKLTAPLQDYIDIQNFNADRGFGRTNLGNIYLAQGLYEQAEKEYLGAISVEPNFANSYANLADLYRGQGRDKDTITTLQQGMKAQPNSALLPYSAGLAMFRQKNQSETIRYLQLATEIDANNPQYWYVYGLAVESNNVSEAGKSLEKAYNLSGNPQHLFALCDLQVRYKSPSASVCISQLEKIAPPEAVKQLKAKMK